MAAEFGLGRPLGPLRYAARGELGRVFRLETDRGSWAVKELFLPDPPAAIEANAAFQDAVRAAGVPMPAVVRAPDGSVVRQAGAPIRVYEWVNLAAGQRVDPVAASRVLGVIHALAWPAAPGAVAHPFYAEAVGPTRWDELSEAVSRATPPWGPGLLRLIPELRACETLIAEAAEAAPAAASTLSWCHLDYNADNVVPTVAGELMVLDWENAGPALPRAEYASALWEFGRDRRDMAAMKRSYEQAGHDGRLVPADFGLALAVQGHLAEFYALRALDPASSPDDQERSAWRLEEMILRSLTRAAVEQVVAAVE